MRRAKRAKVGARLAWLCALLVLAASEVGGASAPALKNATLVAGQLEAQGRLLVAGADGARVRLAPQVELRVDPGSTFRLGAHVKLPVPRGATPLVRTRVVIVERGRVDVAMPIVKRPSFACLITGPGEVQVLVKGGRATLIARAAGATVASEIGEALVSNGGGWLRLPEGMVRAFEGESKVGTKTALPPAPERPSLSRRLLLAGDGPESVTRVSWERPGEVAGYEVVLEDEATRARRSSSAREPWLELGGLAPGRYRVAVRALDGSGLAGAWSESVAFKVIGVEVPPAARLEQGGALSLLPGQRVRPIGAQGFEVAYAGLDRFVPLPDTLGLVQRRPITARLRDPSSGESVSLRLEPLTVKAAIDLPRSPRRWPASGLPITVRLRDQRGRPVSGVRAAIQVSVNLAPQKLVWREGEGTWSSVIASPVGEAPWLVRVDVLDERGVSLGKDFTEIGYEL
jgi:hypothetical protein